jgi:hypothetical protein
MKPQKKHHFEQIMNITQRYDKNHPQIKSQKAILDIAEIKKLHKGLTNRIQQQQTNNRGKTFVLKREFI